jgi:hypothetical protein
MRFLTPSLPSIQFRKRKCPEFARTATHWKNFTSSFKKQKGTEKPLPPSREEVLWLLLSLILENFKFSGVQPHRYALEEFRFQL